MQKVKNYEMVSLIYDHLMDKVDYNLWANYIKKITSLKRSAKVLEVGSGKGQIAMKLKRSAPNIICTDLSLHMLKGVKKKLPTVCCDMEYLPFNEKFDLIFSTFDTVNYLSSKKKLLMFFNTIGGLLNDDGVFTFDASMKNNSLAHMRSSKNKGELKGIKYRRESSFNENTSVHTNKFFIDYKGESFEEIHKQKIFSFEDYFRCIAQTNLYVSDCLEAFSFKPGNERSKRLQFVLRKEKQNAFD